MPVRSRKCLACGWRYEVLAKGDVVLTIDLPNGDDRDVCPACESPEHVGIASAPRHIDSDSRWYGKYNRGLGCYVDSRAHHQQLLAERGLEQADWGDIERNHSRRVTEERRREAAFVEDHQRRLATDTEYRQVVEEGIPVKRPEPVVARVSGVASEAS